MGGRGENRMRKGRENEEGGRKRGEKREMSGVSFRRCLVSPLRDICLVSPLNRYTSGVSSRRPVRLVSPLTDIHLVSPQGDLYVWCLDRHRAASQEARGRLVFLRDGERDEMSEAGEGGRGGMGGFG
ncbi:hypothetical protein NHX12_014384 [Muraenolepis orangiensis]|uniref:Uncharacterized protein n=1 Tax=Muraenolepis orangiensis TaxID=630683 RepID=A0A9Q0DER8_9TELE|nr:hypothetical protein NHX12_014384 [Muraenolepis orangiensis]